MAKCSGEHLKKEVVPDCQYVISRRRGQSNSFVLSLKILEGEKNLMFLELKPEKLLERIRPIKE